MASQLGEKWLMETESKDPFLAAHAKSVYIAARKVTAKGQKVNLNLKQFVERFKCYHCQILMLQNF